MKELQNFLYKHMDALKHHKRYVAMLTALSLLVSFMVPLILIEPADSMTKQKLMLLSDSTGSSYPTSFGETISNNPSNMVPNAAGTDGNGANGNQVGDAIYSPAQMDILTLLFGAANDGTGNLTHQDLYAGCTTIEEALEVDKETYFLGYASDFCAFIEGDFTATEADAEGRMAVGGDLTFTKDWNYQIGSGDYATMKPLQSIDNYDEYDNIYGFASALVGGKMSRINTLSTGWGSNRDLNNASNFNPEDDRGHHAVNRTDQYSYTVYYNPDEGLFKKFIVGDVANSTHYSKNDGDVKDVPYYANNVDNQTGNCKHDYPGDCIECSGDSNDAHRYLGNVNELAQMYSMPEGYTVNGLIQDTFEYVRSRSEVLSHIQSIAADTSTAGKVVFDATGKVSSNADTVYFSIPSWSADYKEIEFKGIPQNANIVINCGTTDPVCISADSEDRKGTSGDWDVKTILNGVTISKSGAKVNNHEDSSRILYNFYNTNEVHINGSFNGTILSPNADAKSADDQCPGHLSGALIAKSYYGGLEFGYRPYRAGSDILGMTSGYEVPVDKLIAGTTTLLPGAMFEIAEVINGEENVLSLFESDDSTKYVALPSYIDFSGNTAYIGESIKSDVVKVDETESFNNVGTIYSDLVITVSKDQNQNETLFSPITVNSGTVLYLKTNHQANWTEPAKNNDNYNLEYVDNYTRKLTINNDNEKSLKFIASINNNSSISDEVTINVNPVSLNVSPTEINWGDVLTFTHSGYPSDYRYEYCINNDQNRKFTTTDSEYEIAYTYDVTGKVPISLNVYNNYNSVVRTENYEITVNKPEIILPEECYKDASVNMSLSFTPADCSVEYYQVDSYDNNNTQYINGTQFNPSATGTYNIRAKITKNNQSSIYTDTKTITVVEKLEPYFWVSSSTTNINNGITFEVKNLPDNVTVNNYSVTGGTISNNNTFTADQAGTYTITANLSNGGTLTATITVSDTQGGDTSSEMSLEVTVKSNGQTVTDGKYYINDEVAFSINNLNGQNAQYELKYRDDNGSYSTIGNGNVTSNPIYSIKPDRKGYLMLIVTVNTTTFEKEIYVEDSYRPQNTSYSLRRSSNYLADETVQIAAISGNMFVIQSPDSKPIIKADLNLHNDNDYTIKYKIYSNNELKFTSDNITKNSLNNGNLVIEPSADYKADKIEIEIISGAVSLNSGNLTYEGSAIKTTHQAALEIQPDNDKKYTVTIQDTLSKIKDSMIQLDSFIFYLSPNASSGEINTNCWIYYQEDGQTKEQYIDNCKFVDGEFCLTVNKMIDKIVIQAKDNNTELPIERFLAVATTNEEKDETINKDVTETHKYTIKEVMAPQGYFKTEDYYEVTITETLNTANVVNNTIPMLVDTVIDVKFVDAANGNAGISHYNAALAIKYDTDESGNPDLNTRIIEVKNGTEIVETFTIVKNNDGDKITSVKSGDTELQDSDGTALTDCKATEFTHNGNKYYYNPETMMIIPLPSENEKNLEFSNEPGLLFKKVDERGALVDGATITVTTQNGEVIFTDSSKLFNLSDFDAGVEYTFTETATPNGYETAKPVHFMLNEDKTEVKWWSDDEAEPETYTSISEAVIEMVDERILGAKLKLKKIDADTKSTLSGAKFALYASDDTLIKAEIDAGDGTGVDIDLTQGIEDAGNKFVENGYLKPGSYYLLETSRPVDSSNYPYKDPGKICFTVGDAANNYGITYVPNTSGGSGSGSGSASGGTLTKDEGDAGWGDGTYNYWLNDLNGISMKETNSGGKIENVKRIQVVLTPWNGNAIQLKQCWTNLGQTCDTGITDKFTGENTVSRELDWTLDSATDLTQFKIVGSSIIVAYIKITTSDNTEYVYQDASYNPVSTASLEDEISTAAEGDEPAVIDETDADTKAPILAPDTSEGDNKTTLVIGNEVDDGKVDITVKKVWPNDCFDSARPSVTIKLYRTTTEISETERNDPSTIKNGEQVFDSDGNPVEVTLSGDTWSHTFTDLESRYADENGDYGYYYYYIVEDSVVGYTTASYTIVGNELTVTNKLDSVEVKVEKIWNTDNADTIPESVTLQLQIRVESDVNGPLQPENYTWENVEGKTITLVKSVFDGLTTWSGDTYKIEGLLKGKTYRLTETDVSGWRITDGSQKVLTINSDGNFTDLNGNTTDGKLSITNEPKPPETGNLTISKYWDTDEGKPGEVYVKLYRKAIEEYWPEQSDTDVQQDYARLLQYSLYFYDANMCGDAAEEHSALSWRNNCHTDDEVPGGYHDAGDHVMFGLPQGYSASMLGWSYYEFKDAYDALGQTEHLKLITEHFCDFFVQSIRDNNGTTEILVQKGAGNPDHEYWGAPELQVGEYSRMDEVELKGDEATGWTDSKKTLDNEMFWRSTGGDIAAEYAAALALAYLNFYDENASQAEKDKYNGYLAKAIEFYNFAQGKGVLDEWGVNKDETATEKDYPGFYGSGGADDDRALAAGWLYLATQKQGNANDNYKNACSNATPGWAFSWNDVSLAAACVYAHVNGDTSDAWSKVRDFLTGGNGINSNLKSDGYFCRDAWGSARYNAALQMVALVAAKYNSNEAQTYKNFAQTQMAKILGENTWAKDENGNPTSVCLVTGFADNSAQYAHHRAASGWDTHTEYKANSNYDKDGHMLIGAMVGGPSFKAHDEQQMRDNGHTNLTNSDTHGDYVDDLHDYCCNEVALDYQAGLVGAAAGLYHFFKSGHTYEIPGVEKQYLQNETEAVTVDAGTYSSPTITQDNAVSVLVDESSINPTPVLTLSSDDISFDTLKDLTSDDLSNIVRIKFVFDYEKDENSSGFGVNIYCDGDYVCTYSQSNNSSGEYEYVYNLSEAKDVENVKIDHNYANGTLTIKNVYFYATNSSDEEDGNTGSDTQEFTLSIDKSMIKVNDGSATLTPNPSDNVQYPTINGLNINQNTVTGSIAGQYTIGLTRGEESANVTLNVVGLNKQATEIQKDSYTEWSFEGLPDNVNPTWNITNNNNNVNVEYLDNQRKIKITGISAGTVNIKATVNHNGTTLEFNETINVNSTVSQTPSISGIPEDFRVDDTANLVAENFDGTDNIVWSVTKEDGTSAESLAIITQTGELTAKGAGKVKVTATRGDQTAEATITIGAFQLKFDSDISEFNLRESGDAITLAFNTNETVELSWSDNAAQYLNISGYTVTPKTDITGNAVITVTATYGGTSVTGTINVYDSLYAYDTNNNQYPDAEHVKTLWNGDNLQLYVGNAIGNVKWEVLSMTRDMTEVVSVNSTTGLVTALNKGNAIVRATDSFDNQTADYYITVKLKAVEPGFDYSSGGFEEVTEAYPNGQGYITLTSGESWTKTIENLDLTDENGNYYMYYIVECDNSGNPISSNGTIQSIQGNGATFVPTEYENGVMLAQVKTNKVSVSNSLSETIQGQLPSTGGSGVKTYYYFGGALMLLGIAGFTGLKRRERKRREE